MQFERWFDLDLDKGRALNVDLGPVLFTEDSNSLKLGIRLFENGEAVEVTETVSGKAIIPDGSTIMPLDAGSTINEAWIIIPQTALELPGKIEMFLRISNASAGAVALYATATIHRSETDTVYVPGDPLPDVDELRAIAAAAESAASHAVVYDSKQSLTTAQKERARTNIEAVGTDALDVLLSADIATWTDGKAYNTPSSVSSCAVDNITTVATYSCTYMDCSPGDTFWLTGTGGSGSKLWVWTRDDNSIISRAASNATGSSLKLTAPSEAAHLLCSVVTANAHELIKGASIDDRFLELITEVAVNVNVDSILSMDDNSFGYFTNIASISDIGNFPNLSSYSGVGCIIIKISRKTSRKLVFCIIPSVGKLVLGTINSSNVLTWTNEVLSKDEIKAMSGIVAYIANAKTFDYSAKTTGNFVLNDDIIVLYNGVNYTIARADVLTAAQAVDFVTYDSDTYTFSAQDFALIFNTDTSSVSFVKTNSSGYSYLSKYPILYYHRYSSNTSGLLVDFSERTALQKAKQEQEAAELPGYFETEAVACRDEVEAATTGRSYIIGFLTDTHYPVGGNWRDTVKTLTRTNSLVPFDAIIHGGDIVHGNIQASSTKRDLRIVRDDLLNISRNTYLISGNHDDNYNYFKDNDTGFVGRDMRYAIYSRMSKGDGRLSTYTDLYYDVDDCNLRVILLDSLLDDSQYSASASPWGFTNDTLAWVRDVALDTDKQVVFFSHVPCTAAFDYGSSSGGTPVENGEAMKAVINNFISGGGVVVGFFHGHTHWDNIAQAESGQTGQGASALFKEVCSGTARYDTHDTSYWAYVAPGATIPARAEGTVTQELWDIIVINTEDRAVTMVRFGAGSNRTFTY